LGDHKIIFVSRGTLTYENCTGQKRPVAGIVPVTPAEASGQQYQT